MSIEVVRNYFRGYGMENRILEFDTSSATVELAAAALDTGNSRILSSMPNCLKYASTFSIAISTPLRPAPGPAVFLNSCGKPPRAARKRPAAPLKSIYRPRRIVNARFAPAP